MKQFILVAGLTLFMSTAGVNYVWADGDDPIPFIILPHEGGGGDALTGDWIDPDSVNWNISRSMIYNFQVIGN